MKNFVILLISGLLLAAILITQTLGRYANDILPILKLMSDRKGIWYTARNFNDKLEREERSWLLNDEVRIAREWNGIVHITATNEVDAYMAWGYAIARDRLFQMQLLKLMSQGRLSTVYGSSLWFTDVAFLNLGMDKAIEREIQQMSEEEYALLRAFSNGVNLYLSSITEEDYPIEIRLRNFPVTYWRPADCLRIIKLWEYTNSFTLQDIEKQIIAKNLDSPKIYSDIYGVSQSQVPEREPAVDPVELLRQLQQEQNERDKWLFRPPPEFRDYGISIPGSKMQRGNAVFAGFNVSSFQFPGFFYEVQITTPRFNVYGLSLPGAPLMASGFTSNLAWSFNRPESPAIRFFYQTEKSPEIHVHQSRTEWYDSDKQWEYHDAVTSDIGPVFRSASSEVVARWEMFRSNRVVSFFNDMIRAKSADTLLMKSKVPVLSASLSIGDRFGASHDLNLFGTYNEEREGITELRDVHIKPAPPRVQKGVPWLPKERFKALLDQKSRHSLDDILSHTKDVVIPEPKLRILMLQVARNFREKEWADISADLQNWNMQANLDSKLTPLVHSFVILMRKYVWDEFYDVNPASVPSDEVWVNLALNQPNHPIFDNKNTGKIETASDIVAQALRDAHNLLVIDNGPYQSWSWGEINKIKPMFYAAHIFPDLYDVEDYSFGGYFTTVMPIPSRNPSYGYTHAFVVEFRNQALNAYICTNSGPKTIIGNDENRLNLEMWSRMQYRSVRFATMQQPYDGNTTLILKPYGL